MTVHEHVQQTLSAWRDGQVDPDQRFLAERHLEQCATCTATAEAFARVDALARQVLLPSGPSGPAPSAPAGLEAAVAARLAAEPAHHWAARRPRLRRLWLGGLAAVLVVLALVVASILVPSANRGPLPVPTTTPGPRAGQLTLAGVLHRAEQVTGGVRTLQGRFTRTWSGMPSRSGSGGTVTTSHRFVFASPDRVRVEGGPGAEVRLEISDGPAARRIVVTRGDPRPLVSTGVPLVRPQDQDALAPLTQGLTLWFRNRLEGPTHRPGCSGGRVAVSMCCGCGTSGRSWRGRRGSATLRCGWTPPATCPAASSIRTAPPRGGSSCGGTSATPTSGSTPRCRPVPSPSPQAPRSARPGGSAPCRLGGHGRWHPTRRPAWGGRPGRAGGCCAPGSLRARSAEGGRSHRRRSLPQGLPAPTLGPSGWRRRSPTVRRRRRHGRTVRRRPRLSRFCRNGTLRAVLRRRCRSKEAEQRAGSGVVVLPQNEDSEALSIGSARSPRAVASTGRPRPSRTGPGPARSSPPG